MRSMNRWRSGGVALAAVPFMALVTAACQDSLSGPGSGEPFDLNPGVYVLADPGSGASLRPEADAFIPGGGVRLVLENASSEVLGYNLCTHALERNDGGEWSALAIPRVCTMELRLLDPGAEADYDATLPEDLTPGEYRFRIAVNFMDSERHRDLASVAFQME
jgi:hypothetical protein